MSLEDLTDSIVQLCQECNVWSSTINIPHGNGDILDISAACGSQACTPKCAAIYPEECPNGLNGSYYTFDPSVYGEHSWPDPWLIVVFLIRNIEESDDTFFLFVKFSSWRFIRRTNAPITSRQTTSSVKRPSVLVYLYSPIASCKLPLR